MEMHRLYENHPQKSALQETKLTARSNIDTPSHSLVRIDRGRNKGGDFAFLIHNFIGITTLMSQQAVMRKRHHHHCKHQRTNAFENCQ